MEPVTATNVPVELQTKSQSSVSNDVSSNTSRETDDRDSSPSIDLIHKTEKDLSDKADLEKAKKNVAPAKLKWSTHLIFGGLGLTLIDNFRGRMLTGPFNLIGFVMMGIGLITKFYFKK